MDTDPSRSSETKAPSRAGGPLNISSTVGSRISGLSSWLDVLGSMRFAISSLSLLAIASIVGTVLNQREPFINYVNQFGPFWAQMFSWFGIAEVYNAWWFLLVLAFLILSTSLCVLRNSPNMIRQMRTWHESIRVSSLKAQRHVGERQILQAVQDADLVVQQAAHLKNLGYQVKVDQRQDGVMVVGKRGASNRLGYIFAHVGIVVIALGGLLDSELPLKATAWWLNKAPLAEMVAGEKIPESVKLPINNPSFRANLFVPEGNSASLALVNTHGGRYVQELPFAIELKQFKVEYYSTGMPKLFASDIVLVDKTNGERREATIEVNKPFYHAGMAIYQSSFDDGGSKLRMKGHSLVGKASIDIPIEVGLSMPIEMEGMKPFKLEITGFRAINVENTTQIDRPAEQEKRFKESVATVLSPSAGGRSAGLRNVGPSVQYKLRDEAGQAREFNIYQLPVEIDGHPMFLAGVRDNPNDQFQFLRIPADEKGDLTEFFRLRDALANPEMIRLAASKFANRSAPRSAVDATRPDPEMASQLTQSAQRALDTFAEGGLQAIATYLDKNVTGPDKEKAGEMVVRVLSGGLWELWQVARTSAGLPEAAMNEGNGRFAQLAQLALSDSFVFAAPVLFHLQDYKEIKASVFQVTRSPGKNIVYAGCLALILGVFAMFYIRERRVWCWVSQGKLLYAMSATRQSMAVDDDFKHFEKGLDRLYGQH